MSSLVPVRGKADADPYDIVPYEARPLAATHPVRLATAALRRGLRHAPPAGCRMLDLGCADATNLLPLALAFPDSEFVGVDRSANQIARAREDVATLGLTNVTLVQADVVDLAGDLGSFDYIVAHGLYSWVSPEARERILARFATSLSPRGIGYLSYNALPGWGARGAVRHSLRLHTRSVTHAHDKIAAARAHIRTLRALLDESARAPFTMQLAEILEPLASRSDSYLLHEYLTEHNQAFTYAEVVESLRAHDLSVVHDVVRATSTFTATEALEARLGRAHLPPEEVEATIDLLTCRQFRAHLIGRDADRRSSPRDPSLEAWLPRCEIALASEPIAATTALGRAPASRETSGRGPTGTGIGFTRAAVDWLRGALESLAAIRPASVGVGTLLERAPLTDAPRGAVLRDLLRGCDLGYLELRSHPFSLVTTPGRRPMVSPLTRLDASRGRPVTNQLHEPVRLEPDEARLVALLDGSRDLEAIAGDWRGLPYGLAVPADAVREAEAAVEALARRALLLA